MIVYTIPRSFEGHRAVIQRNAVRSWQALGLDVVFVGRDPGVQEVAEQEFGITTLPCTRSEHGTPLVRDVFYYAAQQQGVQAYFNTDCIFLDDLMPAVKEAARRFKRFVMIGQRWDVPIDYELDFSGNWQAEVRDVIDASGELHGPQGVEYFIWRGRPYLDMPDFAVGRPGYDNWMVWKAIDGGCPIVDATGRITCAHQNHSHAHRHSPETRKNRSMVAEHQRYGVGHATHTL